MSTGSTGNSSNGSHSSTRGSDIFETQSVKKRINSEESDGLNQKRQKNNFVTGLQKKLVEDVKKGSTDLNNARKVLKRINNQFKNPIKDKDMEPIVENIDPKLRNIDPLMIEMIENEIISNLEGIEWSDVCGLGPQKKKIHEIAILPLLNPGLFRGLRTPPKG